MEYHSILSTENYMDNYLEEGERVDGNGEVGYPKKGEIVSDMTTTFVILLAIFFPSCTGKWVHALIMWLIIL